MQRFEYQSKKHPALLYVLRGLLPYTQENLLLSYKPKRFFAELEKVSGYKQSTLRNACARAKQRGYISGDTIPQLTDAGLKKLQPYIPRQLPSGAQLLVMYDVPVYMEAERRALIRLLKSLQFDMVQKSVWITSYDHRDTLRDAAKALGLGDCIVLYECARVKLDKIA